MKSLESALKYVYVINNNTCEIVGYDVLCDTECTTFDEMFEDDIINAIDYGHIIDGEYSYIVTTKKECTGLKCICD